MSGPDQRRIGEVTGRLWAVLLVRNLKRTVGEIEGVRCDRVAFQRGSRMLESRPYLLDNPRPDGQLQRPLLLSLHSRQPPRLNNIDFPPPASQACPQSKHGSSHPGKKMSNSPLASGLKQDISGKDGSDSNGPATPAGSSPSWSVQIRGLPSRKTRDDDDEPDNIQAPSVDEIVKCADENHGLRGLNRFFPSKIVFEARNAYHNSLRYYGDEDKAKEALKYGLEKLSTPGATADSPSWLAAKAQILGDLEEYPQGRDVLSQRERASQSWDDTSDSAIAIDESERDSDADERFQRHLEQAQETFEASVHVQDWQRAKAATQELLKLDPSYFEANGLKDRFAKCKRLLDYGLIAENSMPLHPNSQGHMEAALQMYSKGCALTNLFHQHFDPPRARITAFDHDVCTSLFFSAARVCLYFDKTMYSVSPSEFGCKPRLDAPDWRHQALTFLERGRSRALLDSVIRNETRMSFSQKHLFEEVKSAVRSFIGMNRKDSFSNQRSPLTPISRTPSSPTFQADKCWSSHAEEGIMKRVQIRMNWRRIALLAVLARSNPALFSAFSTPKDGQLSEMRSKIAKDTVMVQFALSSKPPQSLMVLVMTSDSIEVASSQEVKISKIRKHIKTLNSFMHSHIQLNVDGIHQDPPTQQKYNEAMKFLSNILITPFRHIFDTKSKLIIIPSGELAHVPWAMLPPNNPLVLSHSITIIPSLSIWHRLRHNFAAHHQKSENPSLFVVSNSPKTKNGRFRDIPFSRIEALHVANLDNRRPILADQISRKGFEEVSRYIRILHLCAHGTFNHEAPMLSKIRLFKGSLTVLDLSEFQLRAALVVFSSCLSGHSKSFDSGGAFSFAHTLLGSGARAFIGTLWPVDDAVTLLFMMMFYEHLWSGDSPAVALQKAQCDMRCLSPERMSSLIEKLLLLDDDPGSVEYVVNMRFWLLDRLREKDVGEFQKPSSWAAFILTGYGDDPIFDCAQVGERCALKRKRETVDEP